jgi:hypothetical protein
MIYCNRQEGGEDQGYPTQEGDRVLGRSYCTVDVP